MTRLLLTLFLTASVPAFAAPEDEDDSELDLDEDETEEEKKAREARESERLDEGDDLDLLDDEEALDQIEGNGEKSDDDLLGDTVKEDQIDQEGQDNSKIYREAVEDYAELAADEEMLAWERYMERYPNTLYKDRIERRLDDLEEQLYRERKAIKEDDRLDADEREVPISQALLLQNINPRTRVQAGFEWGLPDYVNMMLDYEHGISRELSVHGGLRNRFQTWNFEFGGRYAIVKSSRTQTLFTGIMDFRMALSPAYLAVRPQVAFGQRFGEQLDVQAQVGIDYELRSGSQVRIIGGVNVTGRIDERVAVFVETNYNAKGFTDKEIDGLFTFPVGSFGLKLYPAIQGQDDGFLELNIGASVPYATRYYRWHEGSIMGQVNIYL